MLKLAEIQELSAFALARLVECGTPDTLESPGAAFLVGVRDDVAERITRLGEGEKFSDADMHDIATEVADSAPYTYTHRMWLEFVDVCAYCEENETGEPWPSEPEDMARAALGQIAARLVNVLFVEYTGSDEAGQA